MSNMLRKNDNGKWSLDKIPKGTNQVYWQALIDFFNAFEPLFSKAQNISDFEFVCTLLNIQGMESAGWDPYTTTKEIFETFNKLKSKIKSGDEQLHLFLVLYGLILESSYPYDLIYNLLRIISGDRYSAFCFPDIPLGKSGKKRPMYPTEKLNKIEQLAKAQGLEKNLKFLVDIYNKDLRNAVFHSDYCIYENEIRLPKSTIILKRKDVDALINRTMAYHEAIVSLVKMYKSSYEKSEIIDVHPDFSKDPDEKAMVIVRKGTGVIGVKDNWTAEEIARGKIPYRLCRLLPYEQKMMNKNPFLADLPENKIEKWNKFLLIFPVPIRRFLLPITKRFL